MRPTTILSRPNHMKLAAILTASLAVVASCNAADPKAKPDPEPPHIFATSLDKAWQAVNKALDANRIASTSSDKSERRTQTHCIQGKTKNVGPFSRAESRYGYNIRLSSEEAGKVRISIIAKLEMMIINRGPGGVAGPWKDVTKLNQKGLVKKYENWLYEQIGKSI